MSFWNPERTYPLDARPVTFKAIESQRSRWARTARAHGWKSTGAFLAWAVDFACFTLEAQGRATEERHQEMHLWDKR